MTPKTLKQITTQYIRDLNPCYDPIKWLPEAWSGTVIDLLNKKEIPFQDVLWVVLRSDLVSEKLMRLFAVWCARQVQHLMKDQRSINALDVAERFANGEATKEELDAAQDAARVAARDAGDAARDAAWAAAWVAGWDAARDAARDAAWDAARVAAGAAAGDAAWDAGDAAWDAARDAQRTKLIEMIEAENR